jgi:DNA repair protein RecO (recombination protein O)
MRSKTYDAVVLRAVDVGEADRFCVLFTREAGRLAARARGVRKPGSRMGGMLLPLSRVGVQIAAREHPGTIQSVHESGNIERPMSDFRAFSRAQQGVELLLALTEDGDPMPALFESLVLFLAACRRGERNPVPAFTVRLLHLLGILPLHDDDMRFARLPDPARDALRRAAETADPAAAPDGIDEPEVAAFLRGVLAEVLPRPLRVEELRV